MLSTTDLPDTHMPHALIQACPPLREADDPAPGPAVSVLCIGGGQVLGGGRVHVSAGPNVMVGQCWMVSDLTAPHWAALVDRGPDAAQCIAVTHDLGAVIRASLERYHADGIRRIRSEADKRRGTLETVQALASFIQLSGRGGEDGRQP